MLLGAGCENGSGIWLGIWSWSWWEPEQTTQPKTGLQGWGGPGVRFNKLRTKKLKILINNNIYVRFMSKSMITNNLLIAQMNALKQFYKENDGGDTRVLRQETNQNCSNWDS